jgi:hypothetical protein
MLISDFNHAHNADGECVLVEGRSLCQTTTLAAAATNTGTSARRTGVSRIHPARTASGQTVADGTRRAW